MKRMLITSAVIIGICAGMLIAIPPAQADRPITGRDIEGTYYVLITEVRKETGPVGILLPGIHRCESHGTATVFRDGQMVVNVTNTCYDGVNRESVPQERCHTFEILAGSELLVTEVGGPDTDKTHCQILDNGRMLLCDGSIRDFPPIITWAGTAVKMSTTADRTVLIDVCP